MIGIGIGPGFGSVAFVSPAAKAAAIPVAGAVVVAPLTLDRTNYGSAGGSFSAVGAPTHSRTLGIVFNGTTDAAYLAGLGSADFTCVWRGRTLTDRQPSKNNALVSIDHASSGSTWKGYGVEWYASLWTILVHGVVRVNSAVVPDTQLHTFALKRSSGTLTLYLDGVSIATSATAGTVGDTLALGANFNAAWDSFVNGSVKNLALYHSALSDGNRALVEAWTV